MFQWFKNLRRLHQENKELKQELSHARLNFEVDRDKLNDEYGVIIKGLNNEIVNLRAGLAISQLRIGRPEEITKRIMDKDIEWFDYKDLPKPQQKKNYVRKLILHEKPLRPFQSLRHCQCLLAPLSHLLLLHWAEDIVINIKTET